MTEKEFLNTLKVPYYYADYYREYIDDIFESETEEEYESYQSYLLELLELNMSYLRHIHSAIEFLEYKEVSHD